MLPVGSVPSCELSKPNWPRYTRVRNRSAEQPSRTQVIECSLRRTSSYRATQRRKHLHWAAPIAIREQAHVPEVQQPSSGHKPGEQGIVSIPVCGIPMLGGSAAQPTVIP